MNDVIKMYDDGNNNLELGTTYFESLFIRTNPFSNLENLSLWYVRTFHYDTYIIGGGMGFSGLAEAFMNFHLCGIIFLAVILGFGGKWLFEQAFVKKKIIYAAIYASSLDIWIKIIRSDSTAIVNRWLIYFVLPISLIVVFSKLKLNLQSRKFH